MITAQLRFAARSAYRDLLRAASTTFAGDLRVLSAFREKIRADALASQFELDPDKYALHTKNARESAAFLRKNIVQGARMTDNSWRLRFTKDTELGSNDTIKSAGSLRSPDKSSDALLPLNPSAMNYSALKRAHKQRVVPELKEEDLEESFVRGSGPGGQSVNKTENNVQLLHRPTGLRVSCQLTRSLAANRLAARRLLLEKLDKLMNPGLSKSEVKAAQKRERERQRRKKAKKKLRLKEEARNDWNSD